MKIKNIDAELSNNPKGSFFDIIEFNGSHFGACSTNELGPGWEIHPDSDEFFHILEGEVQIILLENYKEKEYSISAGSVFVVPKGIWHKPGAVVRAKFLYFMPGQSLYSDLANPEQVTRK